ncbi:MAG: oligosaccharide flippase family protein [Victivallales bacterium]|nr:oligosaccharide flippase family protein [Victivallales bacterium]
MVASFCNNCVRMFVPFLRKTLFMWVLGPEYLGLNGLLYAIIGMLMLAEFGFGTAIICYMFKPVADDDKDLLCAYLNFYRSVYRCVGSAIFVIGLCLMPFLPRLIHGNIPADVNLYIAYFLHLMNTSVSYFLFAYRGSILGAHHRNDVSQYITMFTSILEIVVLAMVLYFTHNYYHYVIITIAFTVINNLLLVYATRKMFPDIVPYGKLPKAEFKRVVSDVKAIFMHKIGAVVSGHFDNLIISAFLGLTAVAAFNNYHSISLAVGGVISSCCYSMIGGFGNKIYTESKEENFRLLMKVNRLLMCAILWCAAMQISIFQPFMALWTRGEASLIRHFLTPFLIVIWFYEKQSRETLRMFKNAASLWQQDRWKAVIASLLNLALNFTFVFLFPDGYKLDGVILATLLSDILVQMPWESYAVFSAFFDKEKAWKYWRNQIVYVMLFVSVCTLAWFGAYLIPLEGIAGLVVKGIVSAIISFCFVLAIFRNDVIEMLKTVLKRKKS